MNHPCRTCSSSGLNPRDPAYSCDGCTKPDDYADYGDYLYDQRKDDEMMREVEDE